MIPNSKKHGGFTLIELVVVLALFMLIISITVSIFISIVRHQKRILDQQELLNEANYMTEYISTALRSALVDSHGSCLIESSSAYQKNMYLLTRYHAVSGFYQGIKFLSGDNRCQEFFLDADGVFKEGKDRSASQKLLSDRFMVRYVRFIINGDKNLRGAVQNDITQPRVTIAFDIETQTDGTNQENVFQTTVSWQHIYGK